MSDLFDTPTRPEAHFHQNPVSTAPLPLPSNDIVVRPPGHSLASGGTAAASGADRCGGTIIACAAT
ncbi:MAG: hypothetical protein ACR2Q4_04270, partial [Geminicoccaceae bacterium]